ncbi:unnamed protein product [Peniophora sp. CBMAI 1063]|nr:unnamed protein product [Peniophora sp. CBMAI 1063]
MADSLALRLPVELLLEIFKLAADDEKEDLGAKTAFRLAAVCRAWRTLLLDYGPAWSSISLARTPVTEIMLQRSKTACISLRVDLRYAVNHRELERRVAAARLALTQALDRTRELYVAGRQPALVAQVLATLSAPKPALEVLELSAYEPGHMSVYSLGPTHLAGNMPLRRLALQSTHLSEGSGALLRAHCASLVHLELHTVQGLTLSALLDLLSAARESLQVVMMESMALSSLNDLPPQQIHLPALRLMSFKGLYPPFRHGTPVALLNHVTYPTTARFKMHMHVTHATLAPGTQDLPYAHLASRGLDFKTALLSPIEAPRQPGLRLRCWSSRAIPDIFNLDQRPPAPLDLRVTRGADTPDAVAVAALAALGAAANIASVRRLAVAPLRPDVPWARILSRIPQLNELSVYGPSIVDNLLLACAKHEPSAPYIVGELTATPFLKRLATLNIFGLNLVPPPESYPALAYVASGQESHHASLKNLLSSLPHRIEELCVCYCDARASDMDQLAQYVSGERIVWDGSTNGTKSLPLSMFPRGISTRAAGHPTVGPVVWGGVDQDDWALEGGGGGDGLGLGLGMGGHMHQPPPPAPAPLNQWHHAHHFHNHFGIGHHHHIHGHGHAAGVHQPPAFWPIMGGGLHQPAPGLSLHGHGAAGNHHAELDPIGHLSDSEDEDLIGDINPATLVQPGAVAIGEQALGPIFNDNGNGENAAQMFFTQLQANAQAPPHWQPGPPPLPPALQYPIHHAVHWGHNMAVEQVAAAFQNIVPQANAPHDNGDNAAHHDPA